MDNRRHEKPLCVDLELSKNVETMIQIRMIGTGRVTLPAFRILHGQLHFSRLPGIDDGAGESSILGIEGAGQEAGS